MQRDWFVRVDLLKRAMKNLAKKIDLSEIVCIAMLAVANVAWIVLAYVAVSP